ncbi:MAG: SPOR domain-containing protein [Paludibacter sp.]|nr:SPOR domain-containing protein [Paludibacter sp.]
MMRHIERLLASNDHVIVPGLGVFAVQKSNAVIRGNYILPPRATLGFNPMVHHNDGMLALEISRSQQISYRDASRYIDNEVTLFLHQINDEEPEDFGNLGSFMLDEDGHLLFTPAGHLPFLPLNLGQRPIRLPEPVKVNPRMIEVRFPAYRFIRYAAAVVFIISLLYSSGVNNSATLHDQANLNMFRSFKWEQLYPAPPAIMTNMDSTVVSNAVLPYPQEDTLETEEPDLLAPVTPPYSIVVGAFQTEATALRMANTFSDEFPETDVSSEGTYYKVTLCHFDDIKAAIHYMETLRREDPRFSDAWVIKN